MFYLRTCAKLWDNFNKKKGLGNEPLLPVWIFIMVGGLIGHFILLKNVKTNIV